MDRRKFLTAAAGLTAVALSSTDRVLTVNAETKTSNMGIGDDFSISSDITKDGIRFVTAVPSAKVCSKKIEIQIETKTKKIVSCVFTRGCDGNAKGIGALLKGMTTDETVKRLEGINCAGRGTSCPDQLSKVLKSLKW